MRTWPALEVSRLQPDPQDGPELLHAALIDFRISAIDEPSADLWRVFFSDDAERDRAAGELIRQFPALSLRPLDVPDEDWVARSQAHLRAIRVGNVVVAPPWDIPAHSAYEVIVVRPSMGFGTGHHATTRLCLAALQRIELRGRSVLDVGTGSGVLAIAANRLGATPVVGIDDDPNALQAAEDNLTLNRDADVTFRSVDLRSASLGTFDLVTANLTGALLTEAVERIHSFTRPGAHLILSGFLGHEEADVIGAYPGYPVTSHTEEEEWVCVCMQRP